MQNQFDQWFSSLHSKTGLMLQQSDTVADSKVDHSVDYDRQSEKSFSNSSQATQSMSAVSSSTSSQFTTSTKPIYANNNNSKTSTVAESKFDDEMVNDDIEAFYQAKEELLKRKGGR